MPLVLRSTAELQTWRKSLSVNSTVGFVPTMGALHEGHATLLRRARAENDVVVLSIFVNPKQFAPNEDLAKYPRTFKSDFDLAQVEKVDAIYTPEPEDFYPSSFSTAVEETLLSQPLCGAGRPGHFRGVTTVVLKLFHLTKPTHAYFGLKDAQQFLVLCKMVSDLCLDIKMIGVPTVREADGLALSSRNRFLSATERAHAPLLYKTLLNTRAALLSGKKTESLLLQATQVLTESGFLVEYFELRRTSTLTLWNDLHAPAHGEAFIAVAAKLGTTRLIDNIYI